MLLNPFVSKNTTGNTFINTRQWDLASLYWLRNLIFFFFFLQFLDQFCSFHHKVPQHIFSKNKAAVMWCYHPQHLVSNSWFFFWRNGDTIVFNSNTSQYTGTGAGAVQLAVSSYLATLIRNNEATHKDINAHYLWIFNSWVSLPFSSLIKIVWHC